MALNTTVAGGPFNVGAAGLRSPLLNPNEIFATIWNMIISQNVYSDHIKGTYGDLAQRFKVDGTMYGDTKLFYATNCLESREWTGDSEASNLLSLHRPADPKIQYVQIDQARVIELTVDNYLTKRAWSTQGAFSQFNAVMVGWMADTKRVYESRLINCFVGNTVSAAAKNTINIDITTARGNGSSEEEANRLEASAISQSIADLLVDLKDTTGDYNDYGFLRSYNEDDFYYITNSSWINRLKKVDLPTIFNNDGLLDKLNKDILPARYFGRAVAASDKGSGKIINASNEYDNTKGTIRSLVEKAWTVSTTRYHVFPGDVLPNGTTIGTSQSFAENEVYIEDPTIIGKIVHKASVPFMGAFETNTSFFNPVSLTENKYLIWMHSKPCYLYNYPFLTLKKV